MKTEPTGCRRPAPGASLVKQRGLALLLALSVLVLAEYWPVHRHEFLTFDDNDYVTGNATVSAGLSRDGIGWAFTSREAANWHPVTWLSHMSDVEIFGLQPGGHHLVNMLLHLINTILLFGVLNALTGQFWPGALAAALFAAHPLQVESVAWISERKTVLAALCWLLVMIVYLRYVRRPGVRRYLPVAGLFAVGLMAKPLAVTLPFALLLLDFWPLGRMGFRPRPGERSKPAARAVFPMRLVSEKIPLFLLAGLSSAITYLAQLGSGTVRPFEAVPLALRVSNAVVSYGGYLRKVVWPTGLTFFYPYPHEMPPGWQVGGVMLLLIVATVVVCHRGRMPYALFGWLWFLGALVPMIGLVQVGDQAMADRYVYVPIIGLSMAAAWGLRDLGARRTSLRGGIVVFSLLGVVSLATATRSQLAHWRDDETLYRYGLAVDPGNWVAAYNLAVHYDVAGRAAEAETLLRATLRLRPGFGKAHNNLGNILIRTGRQDEAIQHFREAVRTSPGDAVKLSNLGVALARRGDYAEAERLQEAALLLAPSNPEIHNNLGSLLLRSGRFEAALAEFTKAIALAPGAYTGYAHAAYTTFLLGRFQESAGLYRRALAINPGARESREELEMVLQRLRESAPGIP